MPADINFFDRSLTQKELYLNQIQKLATRLKQEPRLWSNAPVVESLTLGKILGNSDLVIDDLIKNISSGNFSFHEPKVLELVTGDKVRKVTILPWPERLVLMVLQKALTTHLQPQFSTALFSFMKGRSTLHAKNKLKKFLQAHPEVTIAKRDISSYGDKIVPSKLWDQLEQLIDFKKNPLTEKVLKFALGKLEVGIATGSPMTPFFENIYLMPMDQMFDLLCAGKHFYARYGDDFVFASTDTKWIELADQESNKIITDLGLHVAPHKKVTMKFKDEIESISWLGSSFKKNGLVTSRHKHSEQVYTDFKKYFSKLFNRLSKSSSDFSVAKPVLQTAIYQYLTHRDNGKLSKILIHKNDASHTKLMDQNIKIYFVRWISRYFKVSKKQAWKLLKMLDIPSLNHQRRFLYNLGKYE